MIDINTSCSELGTWGQLKKVGILGISLALLQQHFNLLHICDKAHLDHLLRDSVGNNSPADPTGPDHRYSPPRLSSFTYYFQQYLSAFFLKKKSELLAELVHNIWMDHLNVLRSGVRLGVWSYSVKSSGTVIVVGTFVSVISFPWGGPFIPS